jgi:hypothetical protein
MAEIEIERDRYHEHRSERTSITVP